MTSAAFRSSVVTRPTPTTEPQQTKKSVVFEHACLFTHDIRRKNTKRWQDGYLRFHQFNSRVMVYDQSRNFIGDSHFHSSSQTGLEDGDELQLERGGVLVQVAERLSVLETDLTDLLAKRPAKILTSPRGREANALVSTPTRTRPSATRAEIPSRSPFEMGQNASTISSHSGPVKNLRPTKRPRLDDEHVPLRQLLKTSSGLVNQVLAQKFRESGKSINTTAAREPPRQASTTKSKTDKGIPTLQKGGVFNSSSPPGASTPLQSPTARPKPQLGRQRPHENIVEAVARAISPPVSTTNHATANPESSDIEASSNKHDNLTPTNSNDQQKRKRPLRLATAAPRRKLLCQTLGTPKAKPRQKENISPTSKTRPDSVELVGNLDEKMPGQSSTHDLSMSSIFDDEDLSHLPAVAPEPIKQPPAPVPIQTLETATSHNDSPRPASRLHRPFRRHASDTSPTKQAQRPQATLKRAETISVPEQEDKAAAAVAAAAPREPLKLIAEDKVGQTGPWTSEAWDLFGWCPQGRAETLEWRYFEP